MGAKKMTENETHEGGCACGAVRYRTTGYPDIHAVCHCRYCQLRTGSAFGVGAYFSETDVEILSGTLTQHSYQTQSGNTVSTSFCVTCGTTTHWQIDSDFLRGKTAIAVGTFDPPSFWFDIDREIFTRTKADFVHIDAENKFETSGTYKPVKEDEVRQTPASE